MCVYERIDSNFLLDFNKILLLFMRKLVVKMFYPTILEIFEHLVQCFPLQIVAFFSKIINYLKHII